jgi:hypothetical protein
MSDQLFETLNKSRHIYSTCGYRCNPGLFSGKSSSRQGPKYYLPFEHLFETLGLLEMYPKTQISQKIADIDIGDVKITCGSFDVKPESLGIDSYRIERFKELRMEKLSYDEALKCLRETLGHIKEKADEYLTNVMRDKKKKGKGKKKGVFTGFSDYDFPDVEYKDKIRSMNPTSSGVQEKSTIWFEYPSDPLVYIGLAVYYPDGVFGTPETRHAHGN